MTLEAFLTLSGLLVARARVEFVAVRAVIRVRVEQIAAVATLLLLQIKYAGNRRVSERSKLLHQRLAEMLVLPSEASLTLRACFAVTVLVEHVEALGANRVRVEQKDVVLTIFRLKTSHVDILRALCIPTHKHSLAMRKYFLSNALPVEVFQMRLV